jgi:hypothetical protein
MVKAVSALPARDPTAILRYLLRGWIDPRRGEAD